MFSWAKLLFVSMFRCPFYLVLREENYLYIFNGGGCWSYIGKRSGKQKLSLNRNCLDEVATPIHEIMHAIGN